MPKRDVMHFLYTELTRVLMPSADSLSFSVGLWNCQSAVSKADLISAFATHSNLNVLALTETWIHTENTATPAALASNFNFSHTSRPNRRGGGTGQLGKFNDEFDTLLSTILDDGTPLVVLGDFSIQLDKPHAADFLALLPTFDLKLFATPATHKAGKQLDLILTHNCTTHNRLITSLLHTSDHFFIQFSISLHSPPSLSPPSISFRRNLCSLSPSHFSSVVTTLLYSYSHLSSLDLNTATDMLCSTLTYSLTASAP
ncbi:uncharacterized protein LOC128606447 [Ictalurus furcatus]|uniref:uncharacterized protein LOC128606447 n=1 Tax=Ictalurus furcatus TaxID=66913 RepID=UPI0023508CB4|nr:uncharacterized protein LOC128606447 [Ictalurus furcatus]